MIKPIFRGRYIKMKDIRIFVASSKELEKERNYLAFLVLAKEDEFAAFGLRVRLAKWEYVDPKMTEARTEDRYLDEMYNCDAALVLFRDIAGMYTREELDKALAKEGASRLKTHQILFAAEGKPDSDATKLRESLPTDSYGVWSGIEELGAAFLSLVDKVAQYEGLVEAPEETLRTVSAFLAADDELAADHIDALVFGLGFCHADDSDFRIRIDAGRNDCDILRGRCAADRFDRADPVG